MFTAYLEIPKDWINKMESVDLYLRLDKADVKESTIISPYSKVKEKLGGDNKHYRASFIEVSGTIRDLTGRYDLVTCTESEIDKISSYDQNEYSASKIIITIQMVEEGALELYREPTLLIDGGNLIVCDLYFGIEQFNQTKSILNEKFTRIKLKLHKRLTSEEINENLADNEIWTWTHDYGDINHQPIALTIDEEKKDILHIQHGARKIKITHLSFNSSKPKYIKKGDWLDDAWSIANKDEEDEFYKKDAGELDKIRADPFAHIVKELKTANTSSLIILVLLIILIFKI